jgi:transposase-like protein
VESRGLGLRQRDGRVKTVVVPGLEAQTLRRLIRRYVRPGSTIYTDIIPRPSYAGMMVFFSTNLLKSRSVRTIT